MDQKDLVIKSLTQENRELKLSLAKVENEKVEIKRHFNKQLYANFDAWKKETNENIDEFVIIPLKKFLKLYERETQKTSGEFELLPTGRK